MEKKHAGKVKAEFSTSSILKNKFDKDNLKKKHLLARRVETIQKKKKKTKKNEQTKQTKQKKIKKTKKKKHMAWESYSNFHTPFR
jgi:hypothetical protein